MTDFLTQHIEDNILIICINRPDKRNALNDSLILAIESMFTSLSSQIKCVILTGSGNNFSAGLDLSELEEKDISQGLLHSRMWHRVLDQIEFCTAPVISVLNGACIGGGLELAAATHIRVAEKNTFYALPEGQRGIFVGGGASVRLPKLIGTARMMDMMLTGRVYDATEGEKVGFSQYLVEEGEGLNTAKNLAKKITGNAPMTNYALTQVLPRIADSPRDQALMMESLMAAIAQSVPEAKQRLRDFLEGRSKNIGQE